MSSTSVDNPRIAVQARMRSINNGHDLVDVAGDFTPGPVVVRITISDSQGKRPRTTVVLLSDLQRVLTTISAASA